MERILVWRLSKPVCAARWQPSARSPWRTPRWANSSRGSVRLVHTAISSRSCSCPVQAVPLERGLQPLQLLACEVRVLSRQSFSFLGGVLGTGPRAQRRWHRCPRPLGFPNALLFRSRRMGAGHLGFCPVAHCPAPLKRPRSALAA